MPNSREGYESEELTRAIMAYLYSLLLGIAVGVLYALLRVAPPAPPLIALLGLLGMLAGESGTSWARTRLANLNAAGEARSARIPDITERPLSLQASDGAVGSSRVGDLR